VRIAETRIERMELCKPENSLCASVLNVQYIQLGWMQNDGVCG